MRAKSALVVGLYLALSGKAIEAVPSETAPAAQITMPNINPDVARRFARLQQKEENEWMQKQNSEDAQKLVLLTAELRQYSEAVENDGLPPEAVRKAAEVEKLAKRIHGRLNERARLRPH